MYKESVSKPWGLYNVLSGSDKGYKVKRIVVFPGKKLSYQYHKHRTETWVIVSGKAEVVLDGSVLFKEYGDRVIISREVRHRLINPSKSTLLIVIEVQIGDYLGEDDIIRLEDDYNRVKEAE